MYMFFISYDGDKLYYNFTLSFYGESPWLICGDRETDNYSAGHAVLCWDFPVIFVFEACNAMGKNGSILTKKSQAISNQLIKCLLGHIWYRSMLCSFTQDNMKQYKKKSTFKVNWYTKYVTPRCLSVTSVAVCCKTTWNLPQSLMYKAGGARYETVQLLRARPRRFLGYKHFKYLTCKEYILAPL